MKLPLQVAFLGMEPSAAVEAAAREKAARLDHFSPDIMSCRVEIDLSHKHKHQGRPYAVRIHLTLPRHELTVDRVENEDVYVALRDAFDNMRRQVRETEAVQAPAQARHRPDKEERAGILPRGGAAAVAAAGPFTEEPEQVLAAPGEAPATRA